MPKGFLLSDCLVVVADFSVEKRIAASACRVWRYALPKCSNVLAKLT